MWLAITIVAAVIAGCEISSRLWRDSLSAAERFVAAMLFGSLLWLASIWLLSVTSLMTRPLLILRTTGFVALAVLAVLARLHGRQIALDRYAFALLPLITWIAFALWRGFVTPPASLDALSYHLPKAVVFAREHGYSAMRDLRFMLSWRPPNYELLLADALLLDGSDRVTEWISTFFYLSFVASAVVLGQRWWKPNWTTAVVTALLAGGVPVALLHSADYKNDVMGAFFMAASLLFLGRWWSDTDVRDLSVCCLALAAAAGTKMHGAIFAAVALPMLCWPFVRGSIHLRKALPVLAATFVIALLLGPLAYLTRIGDRFRPTVEAAQPVNYGQTTYGQWSNLWKGPYVLIVENFSLQSDRLTVPWSAEPWLWQRYELYYSELGVAFAVCALVMPFVIWRRREGRANERFAGIVVTLIAWLAILPFGSRPVGTFLILLPRFSLFIVPVVFACAVGAIAERWPRTMPLLVGVALLQFSLYAYENAERDTFAPLDYVIYASQHPTKRLPPVAVGRAAAVLDEMAGPTDAVAFDGGTSSFIHPAYGSCLTRRVDFIPPGSGPPLIANEVQWVAIDRAWNLIWGNHDLTDLGAATRLLRHGEPTVEDLRVLRALHDDPRFEMVFFNPAALQAVFHRRSSR